MRRQRIDSNPPPPKLFSRSVTHSSHVQPIYDAPPSFPYISLSLPLSLPLSLSVSHPDAFDQSQAEDAKSGGAPARGGDKPEATTQPENAETEDKVEGGVVVGGGGRQGGLQWGGVSLAGIISKEQSSVVSPKAVVESMQVEDLD